MVKRNTLLLLLAGVRFGYHFGKAASAASENM